MLKKITLSLFILFNLELNAQDSSCDIARDLFQTVKNNHLVSLDLDSAYANRVSQVLKFQLDPENFILPKIAHENFDDLVLNYILHLSKGKCPKIDTLKSLYLYYLDETKTWAQSLEKEKIDFTKETSVNLFNRNILSSSYLKSRRMDLLKIKTFNLAIIEKQEFTQIDSLYLIELFEDIVNEKICDLDKQIAKFTKMDRFKDVFLRAISMAFDPHTVYLNRSAKKDLEISLSEFKNGFGLKLGEISSNKWIIKDIALGSPAHFIDIAIGDTLQNIIFPDTVLSFQKCISNYDILDLINSIHISRMEFIHTKQGSRSKKYLAKKKYKAYDEIYESYLLSGHNKVGYIKLNDFYSSFENDENPGCADDIAREIIELKRDNIEGLILDLRNNGGGSLQEAVDLAGIFIDVGILAYARERDSTIVPIKDFNRGKIFNKPVVLLINENSASASEVVAHTLKGYKIAYLVGEKTFGKFIGQELVRVKNRDQYCLITDMQLFDHRGTSYQSQGVSPDLKVSGLFSLPIYENQLPYHIKSSKIDKKYTPRGIRNIPYALLNEFSDSLNIPQTQSYQNIPTSLEDFMFWIDEKKEYAKELKGKLVPIEVSHSTYDTETLNILSEDNAIFESKYESISKDFQLNTGYQLINYWIEINKKYEN